MELMGKIMCKNMQITLIVKKYKIHNKTPIELTIAIMLQ